MNQLQALAKDEGKRWKNDEAVERTGASRVGEACVGSISQSAPTRDFTSPTFDVIRSTAVNARVVQLAL